MNKETRSFIWGLIFVLTCGIALSMHIVDIQIGKPSDTLEYIK